ncbi:MAG TPA: xanthine dehydrogenase family protein molybdopterin-binding subunit, partial [Chloroflexota bacterium]|nr:xanthine dehydrogenase family protein molybdopterin-binding subunit [Chloroflexota bacterium]
MTDTVVGTSIRRVDGYEKITGQAKYAGDIQLPGMLHARLIVSPYPHARIVKIDKSVAEQIPGVIVLTAADLPIARPDPSRQGEPLAVDEAVFNGHPVAAVLAPTEALAEDAVALVEVTYEQLPTVIDPQLALAADAPRARLKAIGAVGETEAHASVGGAKEEIEKLASPNVSNQTRQHRGDVEAGFRQADAVVEWTYRTQWAHQSPIEPQTAAAWLDPSGTLTLWSSTQGTFYPRQQLAKILGLPAGRIKVVGMAVGGGFGSKLMLIEPLVAAIAMAVKQPVLLAFTRSEEYMAANPAPEAKIEVKAGATRDGTLTALQAEVVFDTGAFPASPLGICCTLLGSSYRCPNVDIRGVEVMTNKVSPAAYRAPGAQQAYFALESTIDELARKLGLDPLEFRLKNAVAEGDLRVDGTPWPRIGMRDCLEKAREHPIWRDRDRKASDEGIGLAVGGWPGGLMPAEAGCRMEPDGTFSVLTGSVDLTGTNTSFALIAAQVIGVPVEKIRVVNGDTSTAPFGPVSGGSLTMYMVGPAVQKAAQQAREQVLQIAAEELEAAPEDLEIVDGTVRVKGVPDRNVTLEKIADLTMNFGAPYAPVQGQGKRGKAPNAPGFTVHLAKVRVDRATGQVEVKEYAAIQDVGKAINPAEVRAQIMGGVVQGIGWALREALVYGEEGQLLTASLMDYALPVAEDVPMIDTVLVEVPAPEGPFGAKGVGEPPAIPGPGAIANAVRDAIGARPTQIPLTAERVLATL